MDEQTLFLKKVKFSYSYINLNKGGNGFYSNYVLDNLTHKFDVDVYHFIWKNLAANWRISYQDRNGSYTSFVNGNYAQEVDYAPFWLVNLKLFWKAKNLEIYTMASNLFDTTYIDYGNIAQPGRLISAGVSYQLNFK